MLQPKDWLNGYKIKTCIYAVYNKPSSDLKTCIDWKWEDGKICSMHRGSKRKLEWISILISDKTDLKIKITRDKEGYYIKIKGSIQEEGITTVNIYAPNIGAPQYIRKTLTDIKGENDSNTKIVGGFNTPVIPMDR